MQEHLHYTINLELTVDTLFSLQKVWDYLNDKLVLTPDNEKVLYDIIIQSYKVQDVRLEFEGPKPIKDNNDPLGLRCVDIKYRDMAERLEE